MPAMIVEHDPQEKLYYEIAVTDDTVISATWAISPSASATLADESVFTDGSVTGARVRVGPFTANVKHELTGHLVASSGQEFERTIEIKVEHK